MEPASAIEDILAESLGREDRRLYAVVDGAHFDDIQGALTAAGLQFRALYLDEKDQPSLAAGPHLVTVFDRRHIEAVLRIVGDKPAVVWWVWPVAEGTNTTNAIFKHLRSINMVEIPRKRYDAEPEAPAGHDHGTPDTEYEAVLFRHADPNVVASILPLLDPLQVSRVFADALAVITDAPDFGGLRCFGRPNGLPEKPAGLLQIRSAQYEQIGRGRVGLVQRHVADYLRKVAPEQTKGLSDAQLNTQVAQWVGESQGYGVKSEAGHCRWAYLQLISGGSLSHNPDLRAAMTASGTGYSPDARVKMLMLHTAAYVRRNR